MRDLNSASYPRLPFFVLDFFLNEALAARALRNRYHMWLVSPWLSEVTFSLQGRGYHTDLFPGKSVILLSELLARIESFGGHVQVLAYRPANRDQQAKSTQNTVRFVEGLVSSCGAGLVTGWAERLHAKLYVGQTGAFVGSANLTYSGLFTQDEFLTFSTEPDRLDQLRRQCEFFWAQRQQGRPTEEGDTA